LSKICYGNDQSLREKYFCEKMTHFDPIVRVALQLFYGSAAVLVFHLRRKIKEVTIVGNNLPAFLSKIILQQNKIKTAVLEPLCEKETNYHVKSITKDDQEIYPFLGNAFHKSSFEFLTALLNSEEIRCISDHTNFESSKIEKVMNELITSGENFLEKESQGTEWLSFSKDLRNKENFRFSSLYHCILEDESSQSTAPDIYKIDLNALRYVKYPGSQYIALYEGEKFLFLTKKLIFCTTRDPKPSDIIVGDYIHQEDFTESGYHFCSGELAAYKINLLHEGKDLWIRISSDLFYVHPRVGIMKITKKPFQPIEILQYFQTPSEDLLIDPYSFALSQPRPFFSEEGIYHLHPFHIPKTQQPWLSILIVALIIG